MAPTVGADLVSARPQQENILIEFGEIKDGMNRFHRFFINFASHKNEKDDDFL